MAFRAFLACPKRANFIWRGLETAESGCCTCICCGCFGNFCYTRLRGGPLRSTHSSHAPLSVASIFPGTLFLGVVIIGIVEHLAHHRPALVTRLIKKTPLQLKLRQCTAESLIKIARSSSMSTWCVECKQCHSLTPLLWQLWRKCAILSQFPI